jgi:sulfide dehydrogenase cytochrome subunit
MKAALLCIGAAIAVISTTPAFAGQSDMPFGAAACSGCHPAHAGATGAIPSLAGRKATDIEAAMRAFRTGEQPATVMNRIAKGFSEDEIRAIAVWYTALK